MARKFIFLALTFASFCLHSQEVTFSPPSSEDLMNVNIASMEFLLQLLSTSDKKKCNEDELKLKPRPITNKVICFCDLGTSRDKSDEAPVSGAGLKLKKSYPLLGEIQFVNVKLNNGNDNFLNGVLQYNPNLRKYDGDDKGRTFGFENQVKVVGDKGTLSMQAESYGLSKLTTKNGSRKNNYGRTYLNYLEVNTVGGRLDSNFNVAETPTRKTTDYTIATLSYEQSTENGKFSKEVQQWWHQQFKNFIQYDYVKENEEIKTIKIMGGLGKEWIQNLGRWRCALKSEVQVGMSRSSSKINSSSSTELSMASSLDVSNSRLPWVALNLWLQGSIGHAGITREAGGEISFPIKKVNYTMMPFIGIERHKNERDKKYGNTDEIYHVLGVMIQY